MRASIPMSNSCMNRTQKSNSLTSSLVMASIRMSNSCMNHERRSNLLMVISKWTSSLRMVNLPSYLLLLTLQLPFLPLLDLLLPTQQLPFLPLLDLLLPTQQLSCLQQLCLPLLSVSNKSFSIALSLWILCSRL